MGLSKKVSINKLQNILNNSNNLIGQQQAAQQAAQQTTQSQDQPSTLESLLGGIGNAVGNVGKSVFGLIGTGVASGRDLLGELTGGNNIDSSKYNEGKETDAFKKWLWGTDENGQINYGKAAGESLDAAATLSNFIPGANGVIGNTIQGVASGIGNTYAQGGNQTDLGDALKAGVAGGVAGAATAGLNNKINSSIANGNNLLGNKLINNSVVRGGISGATGGAIGGGVSNALNDGNIIQGALQGATTGAVQGGLAGGATSLGSKIAGKTKILGGVQNALGEMEQDYQNKKANNKIKNSLESQLSSSLTEEQPANNAALLQETENANMYGESVLANQPQSQNLKNKLQRVAETMEGAQSYTTRVQNEKLGIKSSGKVIDNVRKKTGITDIDTQAALAKELTGGADSLLDNIQRQALNATEDGSQRVVNTKNVTDMAEKLVNDTISYTNMSSNKRQQFISDLKQDIVNGDTITAANRFKEQASVLYDKNENMTPLDKQTANVYSKLADELDNLSYDAVPRDNVDAMFETAISEMRNRANQAKTNGNTTIEKAYNKLADSLENEPRTIQAYRSFKKDFVNVSQMNDLSLQGEQATLSQNGANISSNLKRFVNKTLQQPTSQALAIAGGSLSDAVSKTPSTSTNTAPTSATLNTNLIGQKQGAYEAANTLEQALANTAQNTDYDTQNALNTTYGTTGTSTGLSSGSTGTYGTSSTGNETLDRVALAMELALGAGDITAFSQLAEIYSTLGSIYGTSNSTTGSQTKLTQTQQRANAAMNSLNRLSNMTPDTGYNLSGIPIVGDIATFGGNDYESEAKSLAQQIGYMVSGANIKESEAEAIGKAYVPQPFDSEATRLSKLQRAKEIIQQYQNGYATE